VIHNVVLLKCIPLSTQALRAGGGRLWHGDSLTTRAIVQTIGLISQFGPIKNWMRGGIKLAKRTMVKSTREEIAERCIGNDWRLLVHQSLAIFLDLDRPTRPVPASS
jgi:hypothetical protein